LRDFLSTFAIPIGVGLGLLWVWARIRAQMHVVTPIDVTDSRWSEAIAKARSTIPEMRALHVAWPSEIYVKYPLNMETGSIEHVWGRLLALSTDEMRVSLETKPIEAPVGAAPFVVPVSALEDWQLVLPDGGIRAGYTTRAQIEIAKTTVLQFLRTSPSLKGSSSMRSFRGSTSSCTRRAKTHARDGWRYIANG
jgi:hypothetical protein